MRAAQNATVRARENVKHVKEQENDGPRRTRKQLGKQPKIILETGSVRLPFGQITCQKAFGVVGGRQSSELFSNLL